MSTKENMWEESYEVWPIKKRLLSGVGLLFFVFCQIAYYMAQVKIFLMTLGYSGEISDAAWSTVITCLAQGALWIGYVLLAMILAGILKFVWWLFEDTIFRVAAGCNMKSVKLEKLIVTETVENAFKDDSFKEKHNGQYRAYMREMWQKAKERGIEGEPVRTHSGLSGRTSLVYLPLAILGLHYLVGTPMNPWVVNVMTWLAVPICIIITFVTLVSGSSVEFFAKKRLWKAYYQQALEIKKEFESCTSPDKTDKMFMKILDEVIQEYKGKLRKRH